MAHRKRAVTIFDVAEAAGVSVSTVSRVLNDKDDVSQDTYQRVKEVIDRLGYSSSLAAKSMRSRATNVIGLIMPDVEFPFSIEVMKGVNHAIVELNYDLLVFTNGDIRKDSSGVKEQQYVSLLNSGVTDGVIIVTPARSHFLSNAPVVAVDPNINDPSSPAVISTNYKGAFEATEYLIDLGHRRIGFIGGRPDLQSAIRRKKGFEDALRKHRIVPDIELQEVGDFSTETAAQCARNLLSLHKPPTAIFAANDQSAIGVYDVAEEVGIKIPEDVSLIGFDNIPEAAFLDLTTVDQYIFTMGYQATIMLHNLIKGESLQSEIIKIETKLVQRGSCVRI
jgi:LacI family transcriptional regulator